MTIVEKQASFAFSASQHLPVRMKLFSVWQYVFLCLLLTLLVLVFRIKAIKLTLGSAIALSTKSEKVKCAQSPVILQYALEILSPKNHLVTFLPQRVLWTQLNPIELTVGAHFCAIT